MAQLVEPPAIELHDHVDDHRLVEMKDDLRLADQRRWDGVAVIGLGAAVRLGSRVVATRP